MASRMGTKPAGASPAKRVRNASVVTRRQGAQQFLSPLAESRMPLRIPAAGSQSSPRAVRISLSNAMWRIWVRAGVVAWATGAPTGSC